MQYKVNANNEITGYAFDKIPDYEITGDCLVINDYEITKQSEPLKSLLIQKNNEYIYSKLSEIDKEFGNRYIRDFALNNQTAVHDIAYQKIQTAESEAANLRKLLS